MSTPQSSAGGAHAGSDRPWFLAPEVERVLAVTMAIAQELAVARARIDTLERKGVLARQELETFEPDTADTTQRAQWNRDYIARVLRLLQPEQTSA